MSKEALERSIQALDDLLNMYAAEFCNPNRVEEARARIHEAGGTLAYLADVQGKNRVALAELEKEKKPKALKNPDTSGFYFFLGSMTYLGQENFQYCGVVEFHSNIGLVELKVGPPRNGFGSRPGCAELKTCKGKFLKLIERNLRSIL